MNEAEITNAPAAPAMSAGAQLTAARERCGLTIADVAQQLKLSPRQVTALETGDNQRLPDAVFVRGFIRNYARLVKLDAAALLGSADCALPPAAPPQPAPPPPANIPFPTARAFNWRKYAVAAIAVVTPLLFFEFYFHDETPVATVNSRPLELPAPQVVAQVVPAPAVAAEAVLTPLPEAPLAQTAPPPVRDPQQSDVRAATPAPAAVVKPARGEQTLRLRFARASWVEIRDRNGRRILSQLNSAGTEQVVSGLPPLSLVVGNANGVQLIHNEQPVNLEPYTKVDVARLTLE
jgi:cytoskeleton protein RodZ